ncbi:MAG: YciI family protein [Nitrospira sp.]
MKCLCLAYHDNERLNAMSGSERENFVKECVAYDNELQKNGHFVRLEGLKHSDTARTIRYQNGTVSVTDGPYAETKEQIGGILLLEVNDVNHAVQVMSKHPGIRIGTFEIRPLEEGTTK